ncbi:MAG: hypothetical protein WAZ21_04560 [Candidatus Saccharimonadales bacterium]
MNKTYKTQALVLLSIGLLLSPAIYLLFYGADPNDESEIFKTLNYIIYPLPAFISVMCLTFGLGRLHTASSYGVSHPPSSDKRKQAKNNLIALFIATSLLAIIGLMMLLYIIHVLLLPGGILLSLITSAIPLAILVFSLIIVPINIKNIMKQRKELGSPEKF